MGDCDAIVFMQILCFEISIHVIIQCTNALEGNLFL